MDSPLNKKIVWIPGALCLLSLTLASAAYAQSPSSQVSPVQYIVAPENPGPNQLVNIEVQGVGNFLGNSTVTWSVNGKSAASGVGLRDFTFTTGALGVTSSVTLGINSAQYGLISHTFSFNPSLIELVWEADTTVPPFYLGKALYSAGAQVTVFAFSDVKLNGSVVNSDTLSYQWRLGGQAEVSASGVGRDSFTFNGNQLHLSEDVSVDVYSGAAVVGHADITIPASQPLLVFYQDDPLRGILYGQALESPYTLTAQQMTVRAEPYFFSVQSVLKGFLQYSWTLNGQDTSGPDTAQGELTLRQTGQGQGSASLFASLQNSDSDKLLEQAQNALSISFGGQQNGASSFFGI